MIFILICIIIVIIIILFIVLLYAFPGFFLQSSMIEQCWKNNDKISKIVGEYKMFDDDELDKITEKIYELKDYKTERNSVMSTIGIPSYIDGSNKEVYNDKLIEYNELLNDNFTWMYPKLLDKLRHITGKKCVYSSNLSLPGFHIFEAQSWLGSGWPVASLHVDKQYELIDLSNTSSSTTSDDLEYDTDDVISFTVGIKLPKKSGLYLYDLTEKDIGNIGIIPFFTKFWNESRYKIEYEEGYLYIHDGKHFHMISEFNSVDNTDKRITLQGHGIYCKTTDEYLIYW